MQVHSDLSTVLTKAGRLVGEAGCYAVVVKADNATSATAVNCMATIRPHSATDHLMHLVSSAAVVQLVEHLPHNHQSWFRVPSRTGLIHMFVPTAAYSIGAELSYLGFG